MDSQNKSPFLPKHYETFFFNKSKVMGPLSLDHRTKTRSLNHITISNQRYGSIFQNFNPMAATAT